MIDVIFYTKDDDLFCKYKHDIMFIQNLSKRC